VLFAVHARLKDCSMFFAELCVSARSRTRLFCVPRWKICTRLLSGQLTQHHCFVVTFWVCLWCLHAQVAQAEEFSHGRPHNNAYQPEQCSLAAGTHVPFQEADSVRSRWYCTRFVHVLWATIGAVYIHSCVKSLNVMCAAGLWILNVAVETSMFTSVWNCSGRQ
jgi:hypothetical protein